MYHASGSFSSGGSRRWRTSRLSRSRPPLGVDGAVSSECSNESIEDCLDLRNYYVRLHSIALCIHCTLWELVARPRVLNQTNYVSGFHLIPVLCNGRWSIEGGPVSILGPSWITLQNTREWFIRLFDLCGSTLFPTPATWEIIREQSFLVSTRSLRVQSIIQLCTAASSNSRSFKLFLGA